VIMTVDLNWCTRASSRCPSNEVLDDKHLVDIAFGYAFDFGSLWRQKWDSTGYGDPEETVEGSQLMICYMKRKIVSRRTLQLARATNGSSDVWSEGRRR